MLQEYVAANGAKVYLKEEVDKRDKVVSDLVVNYRGAWFSCKNQLQWHETYWDKARDE